MQEVFRTANQDPNSRPFRRPAPVFPDAPVVAVTIDPVPSDYPSRFRDWRVTEADVRRMIRTFEEVDRHTWANLNRTYGERTGTLTLRDGRKLVWRWDTGGARLEYSGGKVAYLVAGIEWYRSESRGR